MKNIKFLFLTLMGVVFVTAAYSQINLDSLSQDEREKYLIEKATYYFKTYTNNYRDDLVPTIYESKWEYVNPEHDESNRHNRKPYGVYFPFDTSNMQDGDQYYGGWITFFADTGEMDCMLPEGFDRFINGIELKPTRRGVVKKFEPVILRKWGLNAQ